MVSSLETITWSKSHVATAKECARKTHFSYFPSENQDIKRLKKLTNRYLWAASELHQAVGDILKLIRQESELPTLESLLTQKKEEMRKFYKDSMSSADAPKRFFEHEYGVVLAKDAWAKQWQIIENGLTWFYGSSWFGRFKELSPEHWKVVDEVLSFDVNGVTSYVKIDCALEIDGKFFLMDWKSSLPKQADEFSMQCAALYAVDLWGAEPSQIECSIVSLIDGTRRRITIDEDTLIDVSAAIAEQTEELVTLHASFGEDPYQLPMADLSVCERCNFKKLCLSR